MSGTQAGCLPTAVPGQRQAGEAYGRQSAALRPAAVATRGQPRLPCPPTSAPLCQPSDTAPLSGWRQTAHDTLATAGAAAASHVLGACTSLLLRALLRPEQMGIWQGIKLLLTYANYANLGASKGAARELARARGSGALAQAAHEVNLAFTVNTLSSLAYAALVAAAGGWLAFAGSGKWHLAWGIALAAAAVLVPMQRHLTFHITLLRSQQAFRTTAWVTVLDAALAMLLGAAGAYVGGVLGLCVATLAAMLLTQTCLWRQAPMRLRWSWHAAGMARLVRLGAPLLASGVAATLFRSLDRLAILACLADREAALGLYSTALLASSQIYGFANLLATTMGPRYAELFGRTADRRSVARLAALATEWQASVLGLLGGLAIVLAQPLLAALLPDYRAGLECLALVALGSVALGLAVPLSQYQAAVYEERRGLLLTCLLSVPAACADAGVLLAGGGLVGLAGATALAYTASYVLLAAISIWPHLDGRERTRFLAAHVLLLAPPLGTAWCLVADRSQASLAVSLLHTSLVAAAWFVSSWLAWCGGGWRRAWRQGPPA